MPNNFSKPRRGEYDLHDPRDKKNYNRDLARAFERCMNRVQRGLEQEKMRRNRDRKQQRELKLVAQAEGKNVLPSETTAEYYERLAHPYTSKGISERQAKVDADCDADPMLPRPMIVLTSRTEQKRDRYLQLAKEARALEPQFFETIKECAQVPSSLNNAANKATDLMTQLTLALETAAEWMQVPKGVNLKLLVAELISLIRTIYNADFVGAMLSGFKLGEMSGLRLTHLMNSLYEVLRRLAGDVKDYWSPELEIPDDAAPLDTQAF